MIKTVVLIFAAMLTNIAENVLGPYPVGPKRSKQAAEVYLPEDYSNLKKYPVVFLLHGYGQTTEFVTKYTGLSREVTRRQLILIVPPGLENKEGYRYWNAAQACCDFEKIATDEIAYLESVLAEAKSKFGVDETRVFAVGHSNGAFMAHRWACETETLSGIVAIAGVLPLTESECKFKRQISVLQIHAVDDETIAFNGDPVGYEGLSGYPGARDTINRWANVNGCRVGAEGGHLDLSSAIPGDDARVFRLSGCNAQTELWTIRSHKSWKHSPHVPLWKDSFAGKIASFLLGGD